MSGQPLLTEVLGISDPVNRDQALHEAHNTVLGGPFNHLDFARLYATPRDKLSVTERERRTAMWALSDLVKDDNTDIRHTLVDWMSYRTMMDGYGTRSNGTATALMIGSISALSSLSFDRLARTEYGAGNTYVIDPVAGADKAKHSTFIKGSGLALPFRSETMDFVHTNQLLHMLEDPSSPSRPPKQRTLMLFAEIGRVLAPGGQLLMTEMLREHHKEDASNVNAVTIETRQFAYFIIKALQKFGVDQQLAVEFTHSYDEVACLRDPARNFRQHRKGAVNVGSLDIYARKPGYTQQPHELRAPIAL